MGNSDKAAVSVIHDKLNDVDHAKHQARFNELEPFMAEIQARNGIEYVEYSVKINEKSEVRFVDYRIKWRKDRMRMIKMLKRWVDDANENCLLPKPKPAKVFHPVRGSPGGVELRHGYVSD